MIFFGQNKLQVFQNEKSEHLINVSFENKFLYIFLFTLNYNTPKQQHCIKCEVILSDEIDFIKQGLYVWGVWGVEIKKQKTKKNNYNNNNCDNLSAPKIIYLYIN